MPERELVFVPYMLAQAIWRYKLNLPAVQFPQLLVQLKQVIKRGLGEVDEKIDVTFFVLFSSSIGAK